MSADPTVTPAISTQSTIPSADRRAVVAEVAIVLVVTFAASTLQAVRYLAAGLSGLRLAPSPALLAFPTLPWLNAVYDVLLWAAITSPAALAIMLVLRSGAPPALMGLLRPRWRDAALGLGFALGYLVLGIVSSIVTRYLYHVTGFVPVTPSYDVVNRVLASLSAGILEETVVLAYVVQRLTAAGLSARSAGAISLAIRMSYHVYYGPYLLPILLLGISQTLYFLRARRLLPVVIGHAGYDLLVSVVLPALSR